MRPLLPAGLERRLTALFPDAALVGAAPLADDAGVGSGQNASGAAAPPPGETCKALGYGHPLRLSLCRPGGEPIELVFHVAQADAYGHDRRADRAAAQLLAWDTFGLVPGHVRALDVGAVDASGELVSLATSGEPYLLTEWVPGDVYAADLRRIAATGECLPLDLERLDALAASLRSLHERPGTGPAAYVRAWRDLVGSGEGVAGIVDGYPPATPSAPPERLAAIEAACLAWRQRHKHRVDRLRRTHGDAHPFNIVFAPGSATPRWLDTSRGSEGDPADDIACLAVNFLFFGVDRRARWASGLGVLWRRFFERALGEAGRAAPAAAAAVGILDVLAPFLAWRTLVLCNPAWYPRVSAEDRDALLGLAERALAAGRFEPAWGEELFR